MYYYDKVVKTIQLLQISSFHVIILPFKLMIKSHTG